MSNFFSISCTVFFTELDFASTCKNRIQKLFQYGNCYRSIKKRKTHINMKSTRLNLFTIYSHQFTHTNSISHVNFIHNISLRKKPIEPASNMMQVRSSANSSIAENLITLNTFDRNFRPLWRMNRIHDKYQMIRSAYYCTTVLETYVQNFEKSFKLADCISNAVPFLFFIPIVFDACENGLY